MASLPDWVFQEFSPVGVDLDSPSSVEAYDRNQGTQTAKDDMLLDRLPVGPGTVFVDLGTGTGSLPVRAAARGAQAHAVDVSENMLEFAAAGRARRCPAADPSCWVPLARLRCRNSGRRDHSICIAPASRYVEAVSAESDRPDAPPGRNPYLWDAMWSFEAEDLDSQLPAWIEAMAKPEGEGFTEEMFQTHVREEFSTFSWILEGMIVRAGLEIVDSDFPAPWYGEFVALRPG